MPRSIRKHPDYPFAEANLETSLQEIEEFVTSPALNAQEKIVVLEFVRLARQYAFLERLIQGEVIFELPSHWSALTQEYDSLEAQADEMARDERELLGLGIDPGEDMVEALDERGIKVFRRSRGPEPPDTLTGAFQYIGAVGPALLVGCCEGGPDAAFILAHEYGHLVMDVDPYVSRFCRWRRTDLENLDGSEEEMRADRFARALLLPEELLRQAYADLKLDPPTGEALAHAAEVFDVAPAVLWRRLDDLDLPRGEAAPEPAAMPRRRRVDEMHPTDLPERFVNLALAAFGMRLFEKPELGRFLRVRPKRLERFIDWCQIPRLRSRDDEPDAPTGEEESAEG